MINSQTQVPINWLVFALALISVIFLGVGVILSVSNIDTVTERFFIFISWAIVSTICFLTAKQLKNS